MTTITTQIGPWALIPRWVIRHPDLQDGDIRLYAALADRAERGSQTATFSQATLAEDLGVKDIHTISRRIARLEAAGAVVVTRSKNEDGSSNVNRYEVVQLEPGSVQESAYPRAQKRVPPRAEIHVPPRAQKRVVQEPFLQEPTLSRFEPPSAVPPPSRDDGFEAFWEAYPKRNGLKVGKKQAAAKWARFTPRERAEVMENLPRYIAAITAKAVGTWDAHRWLTERWREFGPGVTPVNEQRRDIKTVTTPFEQSRYGKKRTTLPVWFWDSPANHSSSPDPVVAFTEGAESLGLTLAEACAIGNRDPATFEKLA